MKRRQFLRGLEILEDRSMMAISITTLGNAYTQNFDTLANTGTSSTVPMDWVFLESGANANGTYTAGSGTGNGGDTYSFGTGTSTERAFGGLFSGSLTPLIGVSFQNDTGGTINNLVIAYKGEQWRLGTAGRTDRLEFQYSLDATSLSTGTWLDFNTLDFVAPNSGPTVGALDGNTISVNVTDTITSLTIATGAQFWLRWNNFDASGADDGLAVDDFSLTATGAAPTNTPPTITSNGGGATAAINVAENSTTVTTVTATDTETPAGLTYSLSGPDSGKFSITSGGVLTFSSAPNFEAPTDVGANNVYDVVVTVTDGGTPGLTDAQAIAVTVTDVVEGGAPPVNAVPGLVMGTEDTAFIISMPSAITVSDPDAGASPLTTTISVTSATTKGTFAATNGGGTAVVSTSNGGATLTIVGPQTQINLALATLQFTPAANINFAADGAVTVTVLTSDGTNTDTDTFNINLNDVNDVPSGVPEVLGTLGAEDGGNISIPATAFLVNDSRGAPNESTESLTLTGVSGAVGGTVSFAGGTVTFTPAADFFGAASFNYTMQDNGKTGGMDDPKSGTGTATFTISEVNDAPTATSDSLTSSAEDSGVRTIPFSALTGNDSKGPSNESAQALTITGVTAIAGGSVSISGTDVLFTPAANFSGVASFSYLLSDNGTTNGAAAPLTATGTASFTITAVDDTPTISDIVNQTIGLNSSTGVLNFTVGDIDTVVGSLTVTATSSNTTLVPNNPANLVLGGSGTARTINVIPAVGQSGTSTITVTVSDGNTTASDTFLLTVNTNTAPTISDVPNQTIPEEGALAAVAFTVNDAETATGSLVVTATSSDQAVVADAAIVVTNLGGGNRSVAITPVANANGPVTITLTVNDGSLTSTDTFTLNITEVNDAPSATADALGTLAAEDAAAFTIAGGTLTANDSRGPSNESGQTLTVTSVSAPVGGTVSVVGNVITFTPAANFNGAASFSYVVSDNGTTNGAAAPLTATSTVTFTISEVNDAPTATADSLTSVAEDSGVRTIPFATLLGNDSTGPASESTQALTIISVTPVAGGSVSISGTDVLFTPATNFNGPASFTYVVQDNGTTNGASAPQTATGTVSFTVDPINDPPSFTKGPDVTVAYNAAAQAISNWATAISAGPADEAGQTVNFNVTGVSNGALFAVPPAISSGGTLTFTPAANISGSATITIAAQDTGGIAGGGIDMSGPQTFVITISPAPINGLPTINPLAPVTVPENNGPQNVSLSGITAGGEPQALQVTASSNNSALIPTPSVSYASPSTIGTLTFVPTPAQVGSALITVTVRDAGFDGNFNTPDDGVTTTTFNVDVIAVNDPPVANDQTIATTLNNAVGGTLTASDPDGPALTFGMVMNPTLGTLTSFNAANGAFTYTPAVGATGLDLFTFSVTDGTSTDTGMVRITILGATAVVTPSGGDLIITGTPDPDTIIVNRLSATTVQVRANGATGFYLLTNRLFINSGGSDDYVVATGVDVATQMDLGEGNDYASGGLQDDTIAGGPGNDNINASQGNNVLWGDNIGEQDLPAGGNDVLSTLGGNDVIYGGGGADQIFSGAGNDYINAGQGNDVVGAEMGDDRIFGGLGDDALYGDSGNDVISGGGGSDTVVGREGDDLLIGGLQADSLNGDEGRDLLVGGDLTNAASSAAGDANDVALVALLGTWTASHPAGLLVSVNAGNDGAPDSLQGYTGDDDFYFFAGDALSDIGLPFMGDDRAF